MQISQYRRKVYENIEHVWNKCRSVADKLQKRCRKCLSNYKEFVEQLREVALSITMSLLSPRSERGRERERSRGTAFKASGLRNRSEL